MWLSSDAKTSMKIQNKNFLAISSAITICRNSFKTNKVWREVCFVFFSTIFLYFYSKSYWRLQEIQFAFSHFQRILTNILQYVALDEKYKKRVNWGTDELLEISDIYVIINWKWKVLFYQYKWKDAFYNILEPIMESIHNKGNSPKHSFFTNFCNFCNKNGCRLVF